MAFIQRADTAFGNTFQWKMHIFLGLPLLNLFSQEKMYGPKNEQISMVESFERNAGDNRAAKSQSASVF